MSEAEHKSLELPWHESLWSPMRMALTQQRVAHGLLIAGTPGVGKRRFAARVAAALLCRQRRPDGRACGVCSGCHQRLAGTHPDCSRLSPEDNGKTIKVEQVRQFSHTLHLTPQYATGRVGWIDPAEALSRSAANSLLKTLEEPPANCHILLLSDRVSGLLATIRSRCQIWNVPAADLHQGRDWLVAQGITPPANAEDRLRTPLALLARQGGEVEELMATWDRDLTRLLSRRLDPVSAAEHAYEADRRLWLDWLCRRGNDLLQAALDQPPADMPEALAGVARQLGGRALERWSRCIMTTTRMADSNADWRLVVEAVYIDLSKQVARAGRHHGF